jgi:hypothetical protein
MRTETEEALFVQNRTIVELGEENIQLRKELENVLKHEREVCIKANVYCVALTEIAEPDFTLPPPSGRETKLKQVARSALKEVLMMDADKFCSGCGRDEQECTCAGEVDVMGIGERFEFQKTGKIELTELEKAQNRAKQGEIAYAHLRKVIDALEKDNAAKQALIDNFKIDDITAVFTKELERQVKETLHIGIARGREELKASMPDLNAVINWLANGCDPKHAVEELKIYQARINKTVGLEI